MYHVSYWFPLVLFPFVCGGTATAIYNTVGPCPQIHDLRVFTTQSEPPPDERDMAQFVG
jgi:hypothetical protein